VQNLFEVGKRFTYSKVPAARPPIRPDWAVWNEL